MDQILNGIIGSNSILTQCALCKSFVDDRCTETSRTATNCIIDFFESEESENELFEVDRLRLFECLSLSQYGDQWIRDKIWNLLGRPHGEMTSKIAVVFRLNGEHYLMGNGVDEHCLFGSVPLGHSMFMESGYIQNGAVNNGSLRNKKSAELHLKYHGEKKALSVLLKEEVERPHISVSLEMCSDCHSFFEKMSRFMEKI